METVERWSKNGNWKSWWANEERLEWQRMKRDFSTWDKKHPGAASGILSSASDDDDHSETPSAYMLSSNLYTLISQLARALACKVILLLKAQNRRWKNISIFQRVLQWQMIKCRPNEESVPTCSHSSANRRESKQEMVSSWNAAAGIIRICGIFHVC